MEKYMKPQATVEEFKTLDVVTTSGGNVTIDPGWGGDIEIRF